MFPYKQFEQDINKWFVSKNGSNAATRTAWGKFKGLQMWHYVIDKDRESLRQVIQSACDAVDVYYQEHGVRRRYLEKYWKANVRSKPEDFREPTALPLSGRALQDWTSDEGYDYEMFEQVMHEMEIKEQARRAARKASGASRKAPSVTGSASATVIQFPSRT
jgi:hypothetical protein